MPFVIESLPDEDKEKLFTIDGQSIYDGSFDENIRDLGMITFHQIKEIIEDYQVQKVAAFATAAFREAANGDRFVQEVQKETDIPLKVIPQREEGTMAFFSRIASLAHLPRGIFGQWLLRFICLR